MSASASPQQPSPPPAGAPLPARSDGIAQPDAAHDPTADLLELTRQLKRRSISFLNHVENDAKVLGVYEDQMQRNLENVQLSRTKVSNLAVQQQSVGWFRLLQIVVVLVIVHILMSVFIGVFPK